MLLPVATAFFLTLSEQLFKFGLSGIKYGLSLPVKAKAVDLFSGNQTGQVLIDFFSYC